MADATEAAEDEAPRIVLVQDRQGGGKPGQNAKDQSRGSTQSPPAGDYAILRGREIWITYNARGKAIADQVQAKLESVGMVVLLDEEGDEHVDWDHDFDYEAKDADIVALVKQLVDDLYRDGPAHLGLPQHPEPADHAAAAGGVVRRRQRSHRLLTCSPSRRRRRQAEIIQALRGGRSGSPTTSAERR